MNKKLFLLLGFFALIPLFIYSAEESGKSAGLDELKNEVFSIWPNGNCADNITGNNRYVLISIACSADYSSENRKEFLDSVLHKGWAVKKESYRIESNSASYFYKFTNSNGKYLYFKLFFRNMKVVWPIHENTRPKLAVIVNNVENVSDLDPWTNFEIPLNISVNLFTQSLYDILKQSEKLKYLNLVYLPEKININASNEALIIKTYMENLKKFPEEDFPFWGLSLSGQSSINNETRLVRVLYSSMKKYGILHSVSANTQELKDTAGIMEIHSMVNTYFLENNYEKDQNTIHEAFEFARKNGYAILELNASDKDARNTLLANLSENISFVDIVSLKDIPSNFKLEEAK